MDDNHPGECSRPLHLAVEDDDCCCCCCCAAAAAAAQAKLCFPLRARMGTSGPVRPPRVLITVYGSRLQTLHRLLLSLLSSHFGPDAVGGENRGLLRDGDSADYVSFVEDSFAVLAENAPPIGAVSLRQRWSQQQACLLLLPSSCKICF
jgi:hypothetical protein